MKNENKNEQPFSVIICPQCGKYTLGQTFTCPQCGKEYKPYKSAKVDDTESR